MERHCKSKLVMGEIPAAGGWVEMWCGRISGHRGQHCSKLRLDNGAEVEVWWTTEDDDPRQEEP